MKVVVFLNVKAGNRRAISGADLKETISQTFGELGVKSTVRELKGGQINREIKAAAAAGPDAIVVGGGDGTLSSAAAALAGGDIPLGILPLGTLNHFAKDLCIPLDLKQAIAMIATGRVATVDLGRVNDRVFINNSSLGIYARAVVEREAHRDRFGLGKWLAMFLAAMNVFRRFSKITVHIDTPDGVSEWTTPLVVVGNNHYCVGTPNLGTRSRINAGCLALYIANTQSRWGMAKLVARAILGRLEQARDFEIVSSQTFTINARRNRIRVALDGEVEMLALPLEYRIWPQALRVFVPEEPDNVQVAESATPES